LEVTNTCKLVMKYFEFTKVPKSESKLPQKSNIVAWKYREQKGLDTLLVYTLKYESKIFFKFKLAWKYSTWVVISQGRNLTELAGICSDDGTCGLMR